MVAGVTEQLPDLPGGDPTPGGNGLRPGLADPGDRRHAALDQVLDHRRADGAGRAGDEDRSLTDRSRDQDDRAAMPSRRRYKDSSRWLPVEPTCLSGTVGPFLSTP